MRHYHHFTVGKFNCYIFNDGCINNTASNLFATAPETELQEALDDYQLHADAIPVCFNMALIDTGKEKILLDTGIGHDAGNTTHGFLYENLDAIGLAFADIDIVLISHAHADHIACNTDEGAYPLFPNARYLIWFEEWNYWTDPNILSERNHHTSSVRRNLLSICDCIEIIAYEGEIVTGVSVVTAFGHTVGHLAVHVQSEGEHFLYTADALHHPLHISHPEWVYHSDVDYEQSEQSRRKLLNLAANTNAMMAAYHIQFPALGRIQRNGANFQWIPIAE